MHEYGTCPFREQIQNNAKHIAILLERLPEDFRQEWGEERAEGKERSKAIQELEKQVSDIKQTIHGNGDEGILTKLAISRTRHWLDRLVYGFAGIVVGAVGLYIADLLRNVIRP